MKQPSREQIEAALIVFRENNQSERSALEDAAPFLQIPWDEPTEEEVQQIAKCQETNPFTVRWIAASFVNLRNAALLPKPDPRREAIQRVLGNMRHISRDELRVDAIITALDALKEGK